MSTTFNIADKASVEVEKIAGALNTSVKKVDPAANIILAVGNNMFILNPNK